jgi:hypothetical protein
LFPIRGTDLANDHAHCGQICELERNEVRLATVLWSVAALIFVTAEPSVAQESSRRGGFWWGLGVSYGWVHVACDICDSDRGTALSLSLAAGGTVSRSVVLGGEVSGWMTGEEEVDELLGSLSAVALWYPAQNGSLYLKGGLGYVGYRIDDGENRLTSSGFGPLIGGGYEFYLTRHTSIQPYLNAIVTIPTGNLAFNGDRQAEGVSLSLVQFGLSVTWH